MKSKKEKSFIFIVTKVIFRYGGGQSASVNGQHDSLTVSLHINTLISKLLLSVVISGCPGFAGIESESIFCAGKVHFGVSCSIQCGESAAD